MQDLIGLPLELLAQVISHVDQSTLKQLRQTCRMLAQLASRELFRTVRLFPDEESYERVRSIAGDVKLKMMESESDDCTLTEAFKDAIMQLKDFPGVQSTVLRFDRHCSTDSHTFREEWPQTYTYREEVLRVFFSWLTSLDTPIKELGIRNLQDLNIRDADICAMVTTVLAHLQSLRLSIVTENYEASPENELEFPEPHDFFAEMPSTWLKPTMGSLEHLTLYCDRYWGFYPKVNFRGIHFPRLKTLALGNFAFAQDSHLEWILSHDASLTELYLDDCTILYDKSEMEVRTPEQHPDRRKYYCSYEKRWYHFFDAFRARLPLLRHFRMGATCWWSIDEAMPFEKEAKTNIGLLNDRYMVCYDGYGPSPYMPDGSYKDHEKTVPDCDEEDRDALRLLLKSLSQNEPECWSLPYRIIMYSCLMMAIPAEISLQSQCFFLFPPSSVYSHHTPNKLKVDVLSATSEGVKLP
ncbi:hypothetical protein BDV26DRAFT_301880 [Aspergillus bertholletiae]|uniref:F-box domain-containing protein n=1 Tax=Aspergillus bertholletiae TaxID=1226010 RepID=A0A5N7ATV9_9EURO|nr:hypothetical protein BDV26DRAFT_301880 [Aspergillus bertholletiae]